MTLDVLIISVLLLHHPRVATRELNTFRAARWREKVKEVSQRETLRPCARMHGRAAGGSPRQASLSKES
jgi:hypothetical protein